MLCQLKQTASEAMQANTHIKTSWLGRPRKLQTDRPLTALAAIPVVYIPVQGSAGPEAAASRFSFNPARLPLYFVELG
jgi:hypothetical protein